MKSKIFIVVATSLLLLSFSISAQAATITSGTLDRDIYKQGELGNVTLTVYNNLDSTIRVTESKATIDYHYADGTVYLQTFFTNPTVPAEILPGQSRSFNISFSLPTNIASGYTSLSCRAETEVWNSLLQRWFPSDHPTAEPTLYIESPYKQQFEGLQSTYNMTMLGMYVLIAALVALGAAMAFMMRTTWKSKPQPVSAPQ